VVVGDVTDILEVHDASIFRFDVCRFMSFCVYMELSFENNSTLPPIIPFSKTVLHTQTLVNLKLSTLKTESACISETWFITTQCNSPRSGLTSTINHHESLKISHKYICHCELPYNYNPCEEWSPRDCRRESTSFNLIGEDTHPLCNLGCFQPLETPR
jgi:hypothetical protein